MPISQAQVVFLSEQFSRVEIIAQANMGNISAEDVDRIFALQVSDIPTEFEQMPDIIASFTSDKTDIIIGELEQVQTGIDNLLGGLDDKIKEILQDVISPLTDLIRFLPNQIGDGISSTVASVAALINTLESRILDPLLGTVSSTLALVDQLDDVIISSIKTTVAPIITVSDAIFDQVQGFASALRDTIPELGDVIVGGLGAAGDIIGDKVKDAFQSFIDSTGLGGIKAVMDAVAKAHSVPILERKWEQARFRSSGKTRLL